MKFPPPPPPPSPLPLPIKEEKPPAVDPGSKGNARCNNIIDYTRAALGYTVKKGNSRSFVAEANLLDSFSSLVVGGGRVVVDGIVRECGTKNVEEVGSVVIR